MKIAISKELNPALRDLTQYATAQMPKIQKAIEPVADFVTNAIKSTPKLVENLQKLTPVISGISTTALELFAGIKIAQIVKSIKTSLIPAVTSLWGVVAAHPIGAIITAVGLVATAVTKGIFSYLDAQLEVKSEGELLIEQHNAEIEALYDKRRAIEDLNDAFYENVDGIQNQTDRTKDLWSELDKLADQYGNVQDKDRARAGYILNELNSALGTEYSMTGHQIDNYRTLSAEIDNVIAKKQAEMMLDAYLSNSTEMTKQRIEARTDYEKYDKEYQEKLKIFEEAEKTFKELTGRDPSEVSFYSDNIEKELQSLLQTGKEYEAGLAMYYARANAQQAKDQRRLAKNRYEATSEYFEKEDQLYEAYSLGQYDRMAEIIYAEKDLTSTTLDESATDAEQRLQAYTDSLEKILSHFQLNSGKMSQTAVDELGKELEVVMKNAALTEEDKNKVWEENFKGYLEEYLEKGYDILPMISFADDLNMSPADLFGDKWREVIQKQRENGHDITELLQLAINSDYEPEITFKGTDNFNDYLWERLINGQDIEYLLDWGFSKGSDDIINSNEFQTAYRETIQQHLENGLDVDGLLKWNDKANLASSEEFVDVFKKTVENKLENDEYVGSLLEWGNNLGINMGDIFGERFGEQMEILHANDADLTDFIKWAEANGNTVGTIFGENFQEALEEFLALPTEEVKIPNTFEDDILTKDLTDYYKNGQNLSNPSKQAIEQEKKIRDVFGDDFMKVIQQQLNKGYDVTNLVKWAENSGEEVSDDFLSIYTDTIQTGIDKGYNITELLKWGEKSGIDTGNMLGKHYTSEVQDFVDDGFTISELIEWAKSAGKKAGDVFGENFQSVADDYINYRDRQEKIEYIRQEIAASSHFGNFFYGNQKTKFMADGGFLSHGQAVVAEAGPELLEVVNGGVRVTPLSENSRNSAVNQGQKIFYSNYTINATISSSYDVSRLAEDLETERRRLERGMGK